MTKARGNSHTACDKVDRREALLEAATELFVEKGYAAAGTREIADRAGVNLGMIPYYFGSKGKLFVAVVHRMMRSGGSVAARKALDDVPARPDAAAVAVCRFVQLFVEHLLRSKNPQACRVMYREVLGDRESEPEVFEALVSSVTAEFTQPMFASLANVLATLAPAAPAAELDLAAQSIVAQCVFYLTHRAFLERHSGQCLAESAMVERTARHVARFSLRALGCDEARIERAARAVFGSAKEPRRRAPRRRVRAVSAP